MSFKQQTETLFPRRTGPRASKAGNHLSSAHEVQDGVRKEAAVGLEVGEFAECPVFDPTGHHEPRQPITVNCVSLT